MSEHDPAKPAAQPRRTIFDPVPDAPMIEHGPAAGMEPPAVEAGPAAGAEPTMRVVRRRGGTPLLLTLLLTAGLGGAGTWAWLHPAAGVAAPTDPQPAIEAARAQVSQEVQALAVRVDALEKRPVAPAADPGAGEAVAGLAKKLDDVSGRMDGLSARQDQIAAESAKAAELASQKAVPVPAAPPPDRTAEEVPGLMAQQQAADLGKLNQGLAQQRTALEQSQSGEKSALDSLGQAQAGQKSVLDAMEQRLAKLEQSGEQAASDRAAALAQAGAAQAAGAQVAAKAQSDAESGNAAALQALDGRVGKLEQGAGAAQGAASGAAKDAMRAIRIEAAEAALQAGQPLGVLPDAPPALTRYATAAPPTEGALRADFPRVAEAARAASQPDVARRSFMDRMLARVQQSVVVRRGDQVLVGDPAAGVLARAQDHVAAGDLKGAADALGGLTGAGADAVRDWVGRVRALLEARAALASMAAHG